MYVCMINTGMVKIMAMNYLNRRKFHGKHVVNLKVLSQFVVELKHFVFTHNVVI